MAPPSLPEGFGGADVQKMWEDGWYRSLAAKMVYDSVFVNEDNAGLKAAMEPFLDKMSPYDFDPNELLVRAGRIPESALYLDIDLPNGKTYSLKAQQKVDCDIPQGRNVHQRTSPAYSESGI